VNLTEEGLKEISNAMPTGEVAGGRAYDGVAHALWKCANTPLPRQKV